MPYKKSERTKKLLCDSALALMEEKGFKETTIRDICKKAEVSIGTFYCYFQTKNDVIIEKASLGDSFFLETVAAETEGLPCLEQIKLYCTHYARMNKETGLEIVKLLFNIDTLWFRTTRPMQNVLNRIIAEGQEAGVLKSIRPSQELTEYVFDLLRGICYNWCLRDGAFDLEERILDRIALALSGLAV